MSGRLRFVSRGTNEKVIDFKVIAIVKGTKYTRDVRVTFLSVAYLLFALLMAFANVLYSIAFRSIVDEAILNSSAI